MNQMLSRLLKKLSKIFGVDAKVRYVPAAKRLVNQKFYDQRADEWRERGVAIGKNTRIINDLDWVNPHLITIGDNCVIGGWVLAHGPLGGGRHVRIGHNVYIGWNAIILPGVNIGDNCIIGAGSVVTKDVLSNMVVAGNPAKVVRERPLEDLVETLSAMNAAAYIGAKMPISGNEDN